MMSEQEQVFCKVEELFGRMSSKRIAIYGLGVHTEYALNNLNDIKNIVGLMDSKRTGETVFGFYVYNNDELIGKVDVIVVIARTFVERLIYERIKHLTEYGIEIYNVDGEELWNKYAENLNEFEHNEYWNSSLDDLKSKIITHDIISFDLFDTLLMRQIIRPHDELGFENEKRLNISRRDIVLCFKYAIELKKQVFIVSDMYYSSNMLRELLELNGIIGYNDIIVSCEYGATKESGELFNVLKQRVENKTILHVGDNIQADIENARRYGIDAHYVMNAYDMLLNSPMFVLLKDVGTIYDSMIIGEWAARVLNTPFALCECKGRITIDNLKTCAAFFAPIVGEFIVWLVNELKECQYGSETLMLFLARDGYLIKRLYDWVNDKFKLCLPDALYFPASRVAVSDQYAEFHNNYVSYANNKGVFEYKHIIAYDLATKGTVVSKLAKIFNRPIELFCFASFNISEKYDLNLTHSYLGNHSFYELKYNFLRMYELLEIMSVPCQTQFLYIDNVLNPVYAEEGIENGKQFEKITEFQNAICAYIEQSADVNPNWLYHKPCIKTADNILGLLDSKYTDVKNCVKESFMFDSPIEGVDLSPWWDKSVN